MKIRKYIYLLLAMLLVGTASGCGAEKDPGPAAVATEQTKEPEGTTEKITPEMLEECSIEVNGVYTEIYYHSNGKKEETEETFDFVGYAKSPEIISVIKNSIKAKAIIENKYFKTDEPQEIMYQLQDGVPYNPTIENEKIFISPTLDFNTDMFYDLNRTIEYTVDDNTSPAGFKNVEINLDKENVKSIEWDYEGEKSKREAYGLQSPFFHGGDVILTLTDNKDYRLHCECFYEPKEEQDWNGEATWKIESSEKFHVVKID